MSSTVLESSKSRAARVITEFSQAALASLAKRWIGQIRWERQVRRGIHALMALDDRMLADMGLTRGAVEYAARHGDLPTRVNNEAVGRSAPRRKTRNSVQWVECRPSERKDTAQSEPSG
jgi:uncharacterized protein YjiS (DUF1127 family)